MGGVTLRDRGINKILNNKWKIIKIVENLHTAYIWNGSDSEQRTHTHTKVTTQLKGVRLKNFKVSKTMGNKHKNVLNILSCEINTSWNNKIILSLLKSLLEMTGIRNVGKIWNKLIAVWMYNSKSTLQSFAIPIKLSTIYPAILFPVFINDKEICFKKSSWKPVSYS